MLCPACASASLRRRPARCTSAARGRRCTTGCSRAATARRRSCCGSRTPTASARRPRTSSRSSRRCAGSGSTGTASPSSSPSAPTATPRSSSSCSTAATPTAPPPAPTRSGLQGARTATAASAARTRARAPSACACPTRARPCRDVIRGESAFENALQDDLVIARADGTPVYHLAVVVDDLDAGITHVVRGADHYSNTPKQMLIQQAMGAETPVYAHLPLLHGPDGKKLSKRHGAASVQELRDAGYLPEAVRNYLALLGWGYDEETTFFTTEELQRALLARARLQVAGGVRRAEAALDERPLPARARPSTTSRARLEALHRPHRPREAVGDHAGEDLHARRVLAAGALLLRRARSTIPKAREKFLGARRAREALGAAREALAASCRRRGRAEASRRPCAARSSGRAEGQAGLPAAAGRARRERPSRPGSSRPSRCSGGTRRWRGSTPRSTAAALIDHGDGRSTVRPRLPIGAEAHAYAGQTLQTPAP